MDGRKIGLLVLLVVLAACNLPGCSLVGKPIAEEVADVVSEYCEREPLQARELYRASINDELADRGHSVSVRCAGDPPESK
jgi:hypothetical protein